MTPTLEFEDQLRLDLATLATLAPEPAAFDPDNVVEFAPFVERPNHHRSYALVGVSVAAAIAVGVGVVALPDHGRRGVKTDLPAATTVPPCTPHNAVASVHVEATAALKFDYRSYATSAGCVTVDFSGSAGHTLAIEPTVDGATTLYSDTSGPMSGTWRLAPGTYTLYCLVSGHRAAGMEATLVVHSAVTTGGVTTTTVAG